MSEVSPSSSARLRIAYFGSGRFGVPTLDLLSSRHDVVIAVSRPDRPARRNRALTPTEVSAFARDRGIPLINPVTANDASCVQAIRDLAPDCIVVIAYGHKLGPELLGQVFAINLHASLLPKYRGAAPINWAMIHGEGETGNSVIRLVQRMDAGDVLGRQSTPIDPLETAGELHDRLSQLGPALVLRALEDWRGGRLQPIAQDERQATPAPKLTKSDGTVRFNQPAVRVRQRIHGLTPWPGCTMRIGESRLRLHRVRSIDDSAANNEPGQILDDFAVACAPGRLEVLEVQPPGGRVMSFVDYRRGHQLNPGTVFEAIS